MNIVLTAINAKYIHSNLAVHSLRAYADEYKDEILIAEYTINQQTEEILMELYKLHPDVLCFSCYIWNIEYVERIVRQFHQICPDVPIWLGGPEVSYDAPDVLARLPEVTGIMRGEGEVTFREVVEYYHGREVSLTEIQGITYRETSGEVVENPWREVMDMNDLPFVYQDMSMFENKIVYYESSRGCPFSCSYCLSSVDKTLRFRDTETVCRELQFFMDEKVPQVKFVDRTFNCNHKHATTIWKYLLENDNGITNFHFEISADLLNEEELELISRMRPGLIQLEIGVQSTNADTIKEIHRTMQFEKVAGNVNRVREGGNIHQHLDLIAGLPYEDLASFQKSFDDVYATVPEQLQLGFLKVLKGSYMEAHSGEYELIYRSNPPYEVLSTKWLSFEDIMQLKKVEEMVEVYYNSGQFAQTLSILLEEYESAFEFYTQLGAYYEKERLHLRSHSRVGRYEILLAYIRENHAEKEALYAQLLTFDFYLRENAKSRPTFAGEYSVEKADARAFYEEEAEVRRYLEGYAGFDKNQLRKMTHLEKFDFNVLGGAEKRETMVLFDYRNRDAMTGRAKAIVIGK